MFCFLVPLVSTPNSRVSLLKEEYLLDSLLITKTLFQQRPKSWGLQGGEIVSFGDCSMDKSATEVGEIGAPESFPSISSK